MVSALATWRLVVHDLRLGSWLEVATEISTISTTATTIGLGSMMILPSCWDRVSFKICTVSKYVYIILYSPSSGPSVGSTFFVRFNDAGPLAAAVYVNSLTPLTSLRLLPWLHYHKKTPQPTMISLGNVNHGNDGDIDSDNSDTVAMASTSIFFV
jgi:hypothetical protein